MKEYINLKQAISFIIKESSKKLEFPEKKDLVLELVLDPEDSDDKRYLFSEIYLKLGGLVYNDDFLDKKFYVEQKDNSFRIYTRYPDRKKDEKRELWMATAENYILANIDTLSLDKIVLSINRSIEHFNAFGEFFIYAL